MTGKSFAPLRTKTPTGLFLAVLTLLLVLFFYDIAFLGKTLSTSSLLSGATLRGPYGFSGHRPGMPFSFDTAGNAWVNEPNPYIIRRVLNGGSLPTWTPYEGLGMPLIANANSEVFNPLKSFLNLFPSAFSQDIFFLLRLLVMGLFTYLFLAETRLSPAACLLGSSFLMLSGYSVWWINLHPLSTVIYLPAVFYFYERWGNRAERKSAFFMSLFLSFSLAAGKFPDVLMGLCLLFLYGIWKGAMRNSFRGMFREGGRIVAGTASGVLMSSVVLIPFVELYAHASPLAKAMRTGSASHTIPLISSVSLLQPLYLGWGNYFYGSWLQWEPNVILPHAGIVIAVLSLYGIINFTILKKTFPYFLFSSLLFFIIYGLLPSHIVSRMPVLGSIEYLKYNAMFYFSLAVMAASAFDHLLTAGGDTKKFYLSVAIVSSLILTFFFFLYSRSPLALRGYMVATLLLSLSGTVVMGLSLRLSKTRRTFSILVFMLLMLELFLYMPREHPDRADPYREPPYLNAIKGGPPHRVSGGGGIMPPLVSDAFGLQDIRDISVLLPADYYFFFENLLGFSMPQTNNPSPLFLATSPFIDLVGVKYILSRELLDGRQLDNAVRTQLKSLRWIRFFDAMVGHTVKGGATYGSFAAGGEERFAFFFPMHFVLRTRLRISDPFLSAGFALRDASNEANARIKIVIENETNELWIEKGGWNDTWMDVSRYVGKVVTLVIEGDGSGMGSFALGDFGLSPGYERERITYDDMLSLHKKELDFLKYIGEYEGLHIYENTNVMDRAFIVHRIEVVKGLEDAIEKLREGVNFREIGLISPPAPPFDKEKFLQGAGKGKGEKQFFDDKVVIKKYAADEIAIDVESKGGLLVLSDLYYPGWKVTVNGQGEQIIKVFGLLRGVAVGEGKSEVLFYYRPVSFYVGCVISFISFVVWGAILTISMSKANPR